eukprot:scaffold260435_cov32-Tisochrysis_lutea.AAC.3
MKKGRSGTPTSGHATLQNQFGRKGVRRSQKLNKSMCSCSCTALARSVSSLEGKKRSTTGRANAPERR